MLVTSTGTALAASEPTTRLVSCGGASCLLVSGHRSDANSEIRINGHPVKVEGRHAWRVSLPVETVREWSLPRARAIDVAIVDGDDDGGPTARARLPIGLLGQSTELALVIGSP